MMSPSGSEVTFTTPKQHTTTSVQVRKDAAMSRTAEVKQRLGPIMERMKSSLAKIHTIEESLKSKGEGLDASLQATDASIQSGIHEGMRENSSSTPGSSKSREMLKSSMAMLKKKLSTLQKMEDVLSSSEDRRESLQHLFLQSSLDQPNLELASMKRRNRELEQQLRTLKSEYRRLEEESRNVESFEKRIGELSNEIQKLSEAEEKLVHAQSQNKFLESELQARQSKINQLSSRGDDLECQVEKLTFLCHNLRKQLNEMGVKKHIEGLDVKSKDSNCSFVTVCTETDIDSHSSWETDTRERNKKERGAESNTPTDLSLASEASKEAKLDLTDFVDMSKLSLLHQDAISSILPEGASAALIKKLMVKIERVERENEDLRALHHASGERICGHSQNDEQVSHLRVFEHGPKGSRHKAGPAQNASKPGRGSFFGFMRSDALHSERPTKSEKARLAGESLPGLSRG